MVPAGLVNNWHRELNDVFHLNFEVFGSEGDVTDRKSNAFEKHHLLIASIDTLKVRSRMARLKAAPPWDLVVFDEAHHLTAYRQNGKLVKTQNFKLAEMLKAHTRDLILLSATPHQGDHFRFWMLVQMLDPALFNNAAEMVEHRHRLNAVVFRRTKADACRPDGSTLFARRQVHAEAFTMADSEKVFYEALVLYLQDGFALAKRQGKQGQGLAFVMTIFQKIAASSFAAVQRTLRRRLIALTIQEAMMHDQKLDIDPRNAALDEARTLIRQMYAIPDGRLGDAQVDKTLADYRYKILRLQREEDEALGAGADEFASETSLADAEDAAIAAVSVALPEERRRIKELLAKFPAQRETKVEKLLAALGVLWRQNPQERMVVFATYLGSVEMLGAEIEKQYPGQGVTVLKGGDHGAKVAAEKRFKSPDGPKVLICTAAGREGINLQHARILFNFDLPWNPMDLEQRIGRIHRYGQRHTAQVYNLVLSDTIEGSIFLLLDAKLTEIGRALGKVDDRGQVAEDLRTQILGQLSAQLNYASLYAGALNRDTQTEILLTTDRELSLQKENVHLLGLDHPLVTAYLRKYRDLPAEEIGVRVQSPDAATGILAVWAVEARGDKGQVKRIIVTLAVDENAKRHVAWERQPEKLWSAPPSAQNGNHAEKKLALLRDTLEPMLQRELEHRGLSKGSRGYEARLIGWVDAEVPLSH